MAPPRHLSARASARPKHALQAGYGKSWAVVIGIDTYADPAIRPLDHAVDDAIGMASMVVGRLGFPRQQVFVVLDPPPPTMPPDFDVHAPSATKAVIEDLLFTRLPDCTGPDDRVLVFFAGHGERRTLAHGQGGVGYLVPSDAQFERWHTYVEMDAVVRAGNLYLAKHVFYLLDACYSGLATARASVRASRFEQAMLTSRARQVLTAGTATQAVTDAGAGGHSLFTGYVLRGLQGQAARFEPGVVTGTELMIYVRRQVAEQFPSEQTPDFGPLPGHDGGDFVFVEPGFSAADHAALGRALALLGERLDERGRFQIAIVAFEEALRINPADAATWHALGLARCAAARRGPGEPARWRGAWQARATLLDAAVEALREATQRGDDGAWLSLGMALAQRHDATAAAEALRSFASRLPADLHAAWAAAAAQRLQAEGGSRCLALLVGPTPGGHNDVVEMRKVLVGRYGFRDDDVQVLVGIDATHGVITAALADLARAARPQDQVLVMLAGMAMQLPNQDAADYPSSDGLVAVFLPADYRNRLLFEREIAALMRAIPAQRKLLVADAPHFAFAAVRKPATLGFNFLGSGGRRDVAYELTIDGRVRGNFSVELIRQLAAAASPPTLVELAQSCHAGMKKAGFGLSTPLAMGDRHAAFPCGTAIDDEALHALGERRRFDTTSAVEIAAWTAMIERLSTPMPAAEVGLGRALLAAGRFEEAAARIERAIERTPALARDGETAALRVRAWLRAGRADEALAAATAWPSSPTNAPDPATALEELRAALRALQQPRRRALLVGIERYGQQQWPVATGALADIQTMYDALCSHHGFTADDIEMLQGDAANTAAVGAAFDRLLQAAQDGPVLFHFAGLGSHGPEGEPLLLAADAQPGDRASVIELGALRSRVRTELRPNLSIVIDAGFAQGDNAWRFAEPSWGAGIQWWGTGGAVERISLGDAAVGGLNFLPAGIRYIVRPPAQDAAIAPRHPRQRGRQAAQAAQAATPADEGITVRALAFLADDAGGRGSSRGRRGGDAMVVLRDDSAYPPLAHALAIARGDAALDRIDRLPLREAETLLQRRLQTGGAPVGLRRELGIVFAALREWASAVQELQRADIEQREAGAPYDADLHYHLGLARFEKGAFADAVAEFDELVVKAPDHALARYHHVLAIDRLIKAGLNELRRRSAEAYLRLGAPLGHADEIGNPDAAR